MQTGRSNSEDDLKKTAKKRRAPQGALQGGEIHLSQIERMLVGTGTVADPQEVDTGNKISGIYFRYSTAGSIHQAIHDP